MVRPLSTLFFDTAAYPPEHIVCYKADGPVTWSKFTDLIMFWQGQLASVGDQKVAVFHNDGLVFLAIIGALWRLGKTALIPANTLEPTIDALGELTATFVGEFGHRSFLIDNQRDPEPLSIAGAMGGDAMVLFTSGSTGIPEPINKKLSDFDAELRMLEGCWGDAVKGTLVLGTVSHHHMYGLPFRLLWPLAAGNAFIPEELHYLEQLQTYSNAPCVTLITSPAHLENIPESVDWRSFKDGIPLTFSAGAPLSEKASARCAQLLGCQVMEIYGSTETGAVAWRRQLLDPLWEALPGISLAATEDTQQLMVKSVADNDSTWLTTADRCEMIGEDRFTLLGRIDNIVKVSGKRVSLTAIEKGLLEHPWVDEVRVLQLRDRKSRIGAVIKLNALGNSILVDKGKNYLNTRLRDSLRTAVEAVALPRYWRYVADIPVNSQGKTMLSDLEGVFDSSRKPRLPEIIERTFDSVAGECHLIIKIPANLYYLSGHFPGNPVLPGVVQIDWAVHFASEYFGDLGAFIRLESIKFQHVITPQTIANLDLRLDTSKGKLFFSYTSKEAKLSSGRIVFDKHD